MNKQKRNVTNNQNHMVNLPIAEQLTIHLNNLFTKYDKREVLEVIKIIYNEHEIKLKKIKGVK